MRIFEEEKEGLEGEPARVRVFAKLAVIYGVVALICNFLVNVTERKGFLSPLAFMFGAFGLLGAVYGTARATFHLLTLGIIKLPERHRPVVQVIVALISAILPVFYFFRGAQLPPDPPIEELLKYATNWAVWLVTIIFGYICYLAGSTIKPLLPFRSYVVAVALVFVLVVVEAHGGFSSGDDEYDYVSGDTSPVDPKSPTGKFWMAVNYTRLLTAAYLGLFIGELRRRGEEQ